VKGWDQTHRISLPEPWSDFWIDVLVDPEMGVFTRAKETATAGMQDLTKGSAEEISEAGDLMLLRLAGLFADHNLTYRDGTPIDFAQKGTFARLTGGLIAGIYDVVMQAIRGLDTSPPTPARRATSRGPSSPRTRSPRATSSGPSPAT